MYYQEVIIYLMEVKAECRTLLKVSPSHTFRKREKIMDELFSNLHIWTLKTSDN